MLKHIPNAITSLNLFSGCMGVVYAFDNNLKYAGYAILIAAFLDFFDGMAARLLNVGSPMGKELDSLADMVSFGFLPAVILYQLISQSTGIYEGNEWIKYGAFLVAIFSALRLAKFNIDTRQSDSFIGLPTPSCALVIMSLPYVIERGGPVGDIFQSSINLLVLTVLLSYLLVAELPLLSLKFKNLSFKDNTYRFILLGLGLVLLLLFQFAAVPLIILIYILLSIIESSQKKKIQA